MNSSPAALGEDLEVVEEAGPWSRPGDLRRAVGRAAGLIVRNQTRVDRGLLTAAPALREVVRLGAGLDNIDVEALREAGVELVHSGGLNARAVGEYALGAALVLGRWLAEADRQVRAGRWQRLPGGAAQHVACCQPACACYRALAT